MDTNQVLKPYNCESTKFENSNYAVEVLKGLQSMQNLSDIELLSEDGKKVFCHKAVLAAVSPYFRAMFPNFYGKDSVNISSIDGTGLYLLVDYMYTGKIIVTKENVKVLLSAANLLQIDYVKSVCAEFLRKQLNPSNCLGIKAFADLNNNIELLSSCEAYIKKQFLEVIEYDEFLSLSFEEVIGLISCNDLNVPFEEKVFECIIKWVQHELELRDDSLPKLMEHVRLPLVPIQYILKEVVDDPLLKSFPKCKDYVIEALKFNLLKTQQIFTNPQSIRSIPRQSGHKVFLVLSWSRAMKKSYTNWYDPATSVFQIAPGLKECRSNAALGLMSDQFVFAVGGVYNSSSRTSEMFDIYSRSHKTWVSMIEMNIIRRNLKVGVVNNCIYAVGGEDDTGCLNSVEVFDVSIQKWRMVSSMYTKRSRFGVGVLNNLIYAVGGYDGSSYLKSVECYNPSLDTWTAVAEISKRRIGVGVGVLNGVIYAVGGCNSSGFFKCAEAYNASNGIWKPIADMHLCRASAGVVILDGLLYVMGGFNGTSSSLCSEEIYNPNTDTWSIRTLPRCIGQIYDGVVVNKSCYDTSIE